MRTYSVIDCFCKKSYCIKTVRIFSMTTCCVVIKQAFIFGKDKLFILKSVIILRFYFAFR